jgi:hypothetical protein
VGDAAAESGRGVMWVNPGACEVCGWQLIRDQGVMWCRCTIESRRDAATDEKLHVFIREWDELAEESRRADQERQAQGEPPSGALIICAPGV